MNNPNLPTQTLREKLHDDMVENKIKLCDAINDFTKVVNDLQVFDFELKKATRHSELKEVTMKTGEYHTCQLFCIELEDGVVLGSSSQRMYLIVNDERFEAYAIVSKMNCGYTNNPFCQMYERAHCSLLDIHRKLKDQQGFYDEIQKINEAYESLKSDQ